MTNDNEDDDEDEDEDAIYRVIRIIINFLSLILFTL